jgi:hypothetical protein
MQKGFELEKVKVLPSPLRSIMNRLVSRRAGRTTQSLGVTSKIKVDLSLIRLETNLSNFPGILKTQGGREKRCGIHARNHLNAGSKGPSGYADFHSKRKSAEIRLNNPEASLNVGILLKKSATSCLSKSNQPARFSLKERKVEYPRISMNVSI